MSEQQTLIPKEEVKAGNEATTNNAAKNAGKGKSERNKVNAKLMAAIGSETDPQKIAFIVSQFKVAEAKERERQRSRKALVKELNLKKSRVNADRIEEIAFDYAVANKESFKEWVRTKYPDLYDANQADSKSVSEA